MWAKDRDLPRKPEVRLVAMGIGFVAFGGWGVQGLRV